MGRASWVVVGLGVLVVAGSIAAVASCNSVLGIDKATVDPCSTYCSLMTQACTGINQEYLPADAGDVCLSMCRNFPVGDFYPYPSPENVTPPSVDTLGCRLWHAYSAMGDPATHCRHAGPLGTRLCGDNPCKAFCTQDIAFCADQERAPYGGRIADCEQACDGGFPYLDFSAGDLNDDAGAPIESGNTLNCRLWHLEKGIEIRDFVTHCPHTSLLSTADTCGDTD
jgi:hypothetical protein